MLKIACDENENVEMDVWRHENGQDKVFLSILVGMSILDVV